MSALARISNALGSSNGSAEQIDLDAAPALDQLDRLLQHGERLEAEEVELHEARRLDQLPVELGDGRIRLRIARQRHQLDQRPVADDHAGGVRRGVAVEAFELLGDLDQARHQRIGVDLLLQLRLAVDGLRQRHRIGRIVRHQLAQPVDLTVRHLQHAADVAQHGARLQLAVGDDLRDAVVPVLALHVADHLVAAILAEVDVEVGHRHAFGIEEALEQKPEPQRVEIGDGQRPGDDRAGARAAARTDRDALRLRPLDEVGDDQEVAGKLHAGDDVDLVGEPLLVVGDREAFGAAARRRAGRPAPPRPGGAAPRLRGARRSVSLTSSATATKRGRIGLRPLGRKAQRLAISMVLSSASGRSANSSAISSALLK